jgi:tetratricopeptide (TPR) repeat protein
LTFITLLRETAVAPIALTNLRLDAATATLTFDLLLYTSPLASGEVLNEMPMGSVPLTPMLPQADSADALFRLLDEPWAAEDWPTVLNLIDQVIFLDPSYPTIREKQVSALVNYGYQRLNAGDLEGAKAQFETAVSINPQSGEAQAGLTAVETINSPQTTYTVQSGDTLFSIAQRYDITVEQLRIANNLLNNNITPQQQLIIP